MRKSVVFLAASGFTSAILLVWAQQWISSRTGNAPDWASSLGLIWTYVAVLLSLTSSIIALYNGLKTDEAQVPTSAMYLLGIAFGMAIVDVGQSLFTNLLFLKTGYSSMPLWIETLSPCVPVEWIFYISASIVFVIILVVVGLSVHCITKQRGEIHQSTPIERKQGRKPRE